MTQRSYFATPYTELTNFLHITRFTYYALQIRHITQTRQLHATLHILHIVNYTLHVLHFTHSITLVHITNFNRKIHEAYYTLLM